MALYGSISSGFPTSGKNFIVNGNMNVWQRGTSLAYNTGGAFFGPADRFWFYSNSGASSGSIDRSTDVPSNQGFTYSIYNNTNASYACGTNVELYRQGEYAPFKTGQQYTLSMWIKGASAGTLTSYVQWRNSHANGTNAVSIDTKGLSYTTSWTRASFTFTTTANIDSNNLELDFEWSIPAGMRFTGVQLEEGPLATTFEVEPISVTLAKCQRYFWKLSSAGDPNLFGIAASLSSNIDVIFYPTPSGVPMRTTPTVTTSAANTFGTWPGASGGSNILGNTFYSVGPASPYAGSNLPPAIEFMLALSSSPGTAVNRFGFRSASGYIQASAEL
jgi:hypothetical protein